MTKLGYLTFSLMIVLAGLCLGDEPPASPAEDSGLLSSSARTYGRPLSADEQLKIARLERQLPAMMAEHHVPGVSFALVADRKLVWSRGYGVRCAGAGSKKAMEPDSVMEACSMSKPFFGYMFLRLVEDETFDLDRPLVEYLGEDYLADDERHRAITARMAMAHTTGLPNWRRGGARAGGPMSLAFAPGSKFRYSGEGFLMLQRAVEKELKTDLDTLANDTLIHPLKLGNTRFIWHDGFLAKASCGHDRDGKVKTGRRYYDQPNAAFTLYTSAEDYARFIVEILKDDRSATHSISIATRQQMLSPISHREDQDADWGLAWGLRRIDGGVRAYHGGANGSGFRCYSEFSLEDGDGLVIMTNGLNGASVWNAIVDTWRTP